MAVAILGVVAALAVPPLIPLVQAEKLTATADAIAGVGGATRTAAMLNRRCARLRLDMTARAAVSELLNTFDCDDDPASAPPVQAGAGLWIELFRTPIDEPMLAAFTNGTPTENPFPGGGAEVRYRPSGRLFSTDATITDDDVVLTVSHPNLTGAGASFKRILFEAHGPICALPRGREPNGAAPEFGCPP